METGTLKGAIVLIHIASRSLHLSGHRTEVFHAQLEGLLLWHWCNPTIGLFASAVYVKRVLPFAM